MSEYSDRFLDFGEREREGGGKRDNWTENKGIVQICLPLGFRVRVKVRLKVKVKARVVHL